MTRYVAMDEFLDALEGFAARGFDVQAVQTYLHETLILSSSLDRYVSYRADRYTRNLVHKTEAFEILVICWEPGQMAPVHGHEGELCWARVERGTLCFIDYRLVSEDPLVLEPTAEPLNAGVGHVDGPADIHAVENLKDSGERAASLHVYSRPYPECDIYDLKKGERRRVRMVYDTMYGEPT
ncbi:MAG: cysteine dioxygenase family protein [Acidiferrobacterales bacterium]